MKTIALANQKGGVGKTTTAASLGIGLSRQGKKVLLIDADAQGNLTQMLGWSQPDELSPTLSTLMEKIIAEQPIAPGEGILTHSSGVHLVPANIELSALEVTLVNTMSRETVLRQYLSTVAGRYDYALIDCMPSLGMLTINALTAADSVIIPVQAQYLPAKGLEQLLRTITRVKRQLNPKLEVDGIVLTMVDSRTTLAREINALVRKTYGGHVFASEIPRSIKAAEISVENKSIYDHDRSGKAALAYSGITGEWRIEGKSTDRGNVKAISTYGTKRINAYEIIEDTLNLKDVRIFDYVYDADGRKTAVLNKKETAIAQSKQELIKDAFDEWIWKDPDRREAICKTYNILFNSNRPREYDGSHINFSGMNPEITLRKHQVNAIAHILYGGNTLLAHVVGAGKTFEMVAAAMESKRLGL